MRLHIAEGSGVHIDSNKKKQVTQLQHEKHAD